MLWRLPVVSIRVVSIQVYSFEMYIVPPAWLEDQGYSPKMFLLFTRKLHLKWTKLLCSFTAWVCFEMTGLRYDLLPLQLASHLLFFWKCPCFTQKCVSRSLIHLAKALFFVYFWSCECSGLSSLFKIMEIGNVKFGGCWCFVFPI